MKSFARLLIIGLVRMFLSITISTFSQLDERVELPEWGLDKIFLLTGLLTNSAHTCGWLSSDLPSASKLRHSKDLHTSGCFDHPLLLQLVSNGLLDHHLFSRRFSRETTFWGRFQEPTCSNHEMEGKVFLGPGLRMVDRSRFLKVSQIQSGS